MRQIRGAGNFLWGFFVGDAPELALGCLVVLGLSLAVKDTGKAAALIVPGTVVALLVLSLRLARLRSGR